jgi:hypothetical protein
VKTSSRLRNGAFLSPRPAEPVIDRVFRRLHRVLYSACEHRVSAEEQTHAR